MKGTTMGSITVAEREHWSDMIKEKVDAEINRIKIMNRKALADLEAEAKVLAIEKMKIGKLLENFRMCQKEVENAEKKRNNAAEAIFKKVGEEQNEYHGVGVSVVHPVYRYTDYTCKGAENVAHRHINQTASIILEDLMDKHPIGKKIRDLEREKSELSNAVWIATSNKRVVDLYNALTSRLCTYDSTTAESEALSISDISALPDIVSGTKRK